MLTVHMMWVLTAHLLHGEVPDVVAEWAPAGGAAGQLGPAVGAHQVTRVTLNTQMSISQRPGSVSFSQSAARNSVSQPIKWPTAELMKHRTNLKDGREDIVKADWTLEQGGQLGVLGRIAALGSRP